MAAHITGKVATHSRPQNGPIINLHNRSSLAIKIIILSTQDNVGVSMRVCVFVCVCVCVCV